MTELEMELMFAERGLEQAKDRLKDVEKKTKEETENYSKWQGKIVQIKEAIAAGQTRLY
jgi:predicted  nucleic acid-binding Zn-ribbon protein